MRHARQQRQWLVGALLAVAAAGSSGLAQAPPPVSSGKHDEREFLIRIPREGTAGGMLTQICRPQSERPAGLVIVNHGSPSAAARLRRKPSGCGEVARYFTAKGFVVAFPLRRGYGETGGAWAETYGKCQTADFKAAGNATADDIEIALAYLRTMPFVANAPAIIVGQSAGGWGTLALASRNPKDVSAYINFAGGRGGERPISEHRWGNCSPDALVATAATWAKSTQAQSLWIYTENDSHFGPELSRRMHDAYQNAGGRAHYALLPPFGHDGHRLFAAQGSSQIWGPIVDAWLARTKAP